MSEDERQKREYEKPVLRKIDLAAEEVLDVGCKTASGSAPFGLTCFSANCRTDGS